MARRLVRHEAALIACALVVAACSKKSPANTTVSDLDPLELDLTPPTKTENGSLSFALPNPPADAQCRRLPEASSVTLNGVAGTIRSADSKCSVEVTWPPAEPAEPKLVIDDGSSKLEISVPVSPSLRVITPTLHTTGAMATFVLEASTLEGSMKEIEASYTPEGGAKSSIPKSAIRIAGKRILVTLPAKDLKPGPYHFDAKMKVATTATTNPPRSTAPKAYVSLTPSFPFTVAP